MGSMPTDFNDLMHVAGKAAVLQQLHAALERPPLSMTGDSPHLSGEPEPASIPEPSGRRL